jgi:hypothetical protein
MVSFGMDSNVAEGHLKIFVLREDLLGTFGLLAAQHTELNQSVNIPFFRNLSLHLYPSTDF